MEESIALPLNGITSEFYLREEMSLRLSSERHSVSGWSRAVIEDIYVFLYETERNREIRRVQHLKELQNIQCGFKGDVCRE